MYVKLLEFSFAEKATEKAKPAEKVSSVITKVCLFTCQDWCAQKICSTEPYIRAYYSWLNKIAYLQYTPGHNGIQ